MAKFKILTLFLFISIGQISVSQAFFWPFTAWSKSSSSSSQSNSESPLGELLFRPYLDDLTALPSNAESSISEYIHSQNALPLTSSSSQNYGQQENAASQSSFEGIQQQPIDTQIPENEIHQQQTWSAAQQQAQKGPQIPFGQEFSFYNWENSYYDPKRLTHVTKHRQTVENQQNANGQIVQSSKFIHPSDNQYLIIQKHPTVRQQPQQQAERLEESGGQFHAQAQPTQEQTQKVRQAQTQQQHQYSVISPVPLGNNWVYLSPLNKLNSQQQPIILEAYIDHSAQQHRSQSQQNSGKNGLKTKQSGQSRKIPLLSWLPNTSAIQLPYWFKLKQQSNQPQETQTFRGQQPQQYYSTGVYQGGYIGQQQQQQQQSITQGSFPKQQPIYFYSPGPISQSVSSQVPLQSSPVVQSQSAAQAQVLNSGSTSGNVETQTTYYIRTPVQVNKQYTTYAPSQSSSQSPSGQQTYQMVWSSDSVQPSSYSQQPQTQSQPTIWIENQPSSTRVQFPKVISSGPVSVQEYQIPTSPNSPLTSVSQIESNQDLGGWDSSPVGDVKPSSSSTTLTVVQSPNDEQQSQDHGQAVLSSLTESMMINNNETSVSQTQSTQQSQQPQSHRIVYQQSTNSTMSTAGTGNSNTVNGITGRSYYSSSNLQQQFAPIYQLLQQQQQSVSSSSTSTNTST